MEMKGIEIFTILALMILSLSYSARSDELKHSWDVFALSGRNGWVMIVNNKVIDRQPANYIVRKNPKFFEAAMNRPNRDWYTPMGDQPEVEAMADLACEKASQKLTIKDFPPSMLQLNNSYTDSSDGSSAAEVASVAISCYDPVHERFRYAQQRATLDLAEAWQERLEEALTKYLKSKPTEPSRYANQPAINELIAKSVRTQIWQIRAFDDWLGTRDSESLPHGLRTPRDQKAHQENPHPIEQQTHSVQPHRRGWPCSRPCKRGGVFGRGYGFYQKADAGRCETLSHPPKSSYHW